jgi:hypothetical protein
MNALARLEDCLAQGLEVSVDALGGVDQILADAETLVASPFLDILVEMVGGGEEATRDALFPFLVDGFVKAADPTAFRDALSILIDSEVLRPHISGSLVLGLTGKIQDRGTDRAAHLAAFALEGLFRLALEGIIAKHRPLLELSELMPSERGMFARHAAKLAGAAYHVWREDDLLAMLERFLSHDEAQGEAAFELGLAYLAKALDGADMDTVLAGLDTARVMFTEAREADEDRADASAYCSAIELISGFAVGRAADELQPALEAMTIAVRDRNALLGIGTLPQWLAPRFDRDTQWFELSQAVQQAARDLSRPSWLNAATTMEAVLGVYEAQCTVGSGIGSLVSPRIEAAFVREIGLAAHLDDLLDEGKWEPIYRPAALKLRAALNDVRQSGAGPGKDAENERFPLLTRVLHDETPIEQIPDKMAQRLEDALTIRNRPPDELANPALHRVFATLRQELTASSEYIGDTQRAFDSVLLQILLFCADRQDAERRDLGPRGNYRFVQNPSEADLQSDLRDFLKGNLIGAQVLNEVRGVGTGRTDIYLAIGGITIIIELKLHEGEFTPDSARRYHSQAVSYQSTNVRLGFLGALEVMDRNDAVPSIGECLWHTAYAPSGGTLARHLIVFRVPGRLIPPSSRRRGI